MRKTGNNWKYYKNFFHDRALSHSLNVSCLDQYKLCEYLRRIGKIPRKASVSKATFQGRRTRKEVCNELPPPLGKLSWLRSKINVIQARNRPDAFRARLCGRQNGVAHTQLPPFSRKLLSSLIRPLGKIGLAVMRIHLWTWRTGVIGMLSRCAKKYIHLVLIEKKLHDRPFKSIPSQVCRSINKYHSSVHCSKFLTAFNVQLYALFSVQTFKKVLLKK